MLLKNGIEINTYTDEDIDTCENTEVWVLEVGDMGPGGALGFVLFRLRDVSVHSVSETQEIKNQEGEESMNL